MQRPFLPLLGALSGGIIIGRLITLPDSYLLCLMALLLCLLGRGWRRHNLRLCFCLSLFILSVLGALLLNSENRQRQNADDLDSIIGRETITAEGLIESAEETAENRMALTTRLSRILEEEGWREVRGLVLLGFPGRINAPGQPGYGDYIRFQVKLKRPESYMNPGAFDRREYYRDRGIQARGSISDPSRLILIRSNQGHPFWHELLSFRLRIIDFVRENISGDAGQIILAMTVGERGGIAEPVREDFRRSGTAHILAISGLHVGIVAFLAVTLLKFLLGGWSWFSLRFNVRLIAHLLAVVPVILYALLAGGSISVIRAALMIVAFLVSLLLGRPRDLLNILAAAAFVILTFSPRSLFDVSFQLSFTAVASILLVAPLLETDEKASSPHRLRRVIVGLLVVSFSAALGTAPLIAHYFYLFSPVSLPANLLVVPLMGFVALPLSFAAIATAFLLPLLAKMLLFLAGQVVELNLWLIRFLVSLPGSCFLVPPPSLRQLLLFYLLLIFVILRVRGARIPADCSARTIAVYNIIVGAIIIVALGGGLYGQLRSGVSRTLTVTALDVGQGSATLIETPGGKSLLIDGGGAPAGGYDVGRRVVAPLLLYRRIKTLDLVVLTHPHRDHYLGLQYIFENFDVKEFWTNGQGAAEPEFASLMQMAAQKNIVPRIVSRHTEPRRFDGVQLSVMHPGEVPKYTPEKPACYEDTNNNSLVLRLVYGRHSFLFPGDIMAPAEEALVRRGAALASTVLFAPHHGSRASNSPNFLQAVKPRLAVISADGHLPSPLPHPEVLARFRALKIDVFSTDRQGAVTIKTDGRFLQSWGQVEQ